MLKKVLFPLSLSAIVLILDQLSKWLVYAQYRVGDTFWLVPNALEFCYVHNFGSMMGIVENTRLPLIIGTILAIVACFAILFSRKCQRPLFCAALGLVIGGGIGNLIDRVFLGFVIDFIRFPVSWFLYSFNIADCAVCIGCGMLVLDLLLDTLNERKQKGESHE